MNSRLSATIAGSLPKPPWLTTADQLWAGWLHEGETLEEAKHDAVRLAVADQVEAGLDIICDGEQTRQHFVTTFIEGLDGVDAEHRATVRIRQRYEASVPRVVGPVERTRPVYVEDARFLRSLTDRPIKWQLPGPMTMVDTLEDDHYRDRQELALVFAEILNAEARELEAVGVDVIQFDEPAFNVFMDQVGGWGVEALEVATAGLSATTAVHICYGYGVKANIDWKATLGEEWRQYEQTFPVLAASTIDQVSIEIAGSRVPLELLEMLGDKAVLAGVIDVASNRIESADEVASTIASVLDHVGADRVFPCTNCGMVPLSRDVARAKMRALGVGAALVRGDG
ncbi:MAG TPA: methionine synthase [Acidimicrobiia bacterium]|nr:methionine synthase [Acidimicrobiia bacterium]